MAFHVILWLTVFLIRKNNTAQMVLLCLICALVYASQYFNAYAADHWEALGFTQDYFDINGVFLSFVFSMPLLGLAAFQLVYSLRSAIDMLVKVKSKELRDKRIQAARANGADSLAAGTSELSALSSAATVSDKKRK